MKLLSPNINRQKESQPSSKSRISHISSISSNLRRSRISIQSKQSEKSSNSGVKSNRKSQSSRNIFDGLTFLIEVFEDNLNMYQKIQPIIVENGGIVVRQLAEDTNYFVFQNGRRKVLLKAMNDWKDVKVVSPQWIDQSISKRELLDHIQFQPVIINQEEMKDESLQSLQTSKKRPVPVEESKTAHKLSPLKSKRKLKVNNKRNSNKEKTQNESQIKADQNQNNKSALGYDQDDLDKTIQQIQEEKFFMKEFAKDLKKFSKLFEQQQMTEDKLEATNDKSQLIELKDEIKQKKQTKNMNKNQLIESYIEGDIELVDFIENMEIKLKDKSRKGKSRKAVDSNRRISEMFGRNDQRVEDKGNDKGLNSTQLMNKSGLISLQDFLNDIDKENTPINQCEKDYHLRGSAKKHNSQAVDQNHFSQKSIDNYIRSLNSQNSFKPLLNHKPQSIFNQTFLKTIQENSSNRIQKSQTIQASNQNKQLSKKLKNINLSQNSLLSTPKSIKRSRSAHITSRLPFLQLSKDDLKNHIQFDGFAQDQNMLEGNRKAARKHTKSKTQRKVKDRSMPTRKMPQRGCKGNISYVEDQYDFIGELDSKRNRIFHSHQYQYY
ncbi:UNKNOWN [Stylonychia lemnae]|uniref:BRCT domain-containing protein n=1 Tax=Stylonychia lemnae TaxID=5949 RepID=A0A077ZQ70_STYLE|nr:UNKNOWN [Stylonychia lemnae]|eukprot:CDW71530.1 UNKNOWN [Stylonychia lemnae]